MGYAGNQPIYGTFPSDLFTGNGSNTVFTMSSVPGNDAALLVTIDGVRQHTDTYSFSANTLTFSEAPGSGAIIETVNMGSRADVIITEGVYKKTQFTATASQTNFTIPTGYTVGFVDVYLNGIRLVVADDYTATDGSTIILASAAASGDSVEVVAYGTFNVANALQKSGDTMSGNLVVSGTSIMQTPHAIANTTGNTVVFASSGAVTIGSNVNIDSSGYVGLGTSGSSPFRLNILGSGTSGARTLQVAGPDTATAPGTTAPVLNLYNTTNSNSALTKVAFSDAAGADVAALYTYNSDQTNHTGSFGITVRGSDGYNERFKIDSAGRITKPYQPCFSAVKNAGQTLNSGATISYGSSLLNVGSSYNTSTSTFTAPIAGNYYFVYWWNTGGSVGSGQVMQHWLYKNGVAINNTGGPIYGTLPRTNVGGEQILPLAAGDTIYVYGTCGSGSMALDNSGIFCGWLIG